MNLTNRKILRAAWLALTLISPCAPSHAQVAAPTSQSVPAASPGASTELAAPSEATARPLRTTTPTLRELSPWSMFLSADAVVKAVMIGLAFASVVTWTIFIAKMVELTMAQRKLRKGYARLLGKLEGGTDSTQSVSEDRDHA